MGTFHRDPHPLHGITCVVETRGPKVYVGRVDAEDAAGLVLLDADVFEEAGGGPTREAWLAQAAEVGVWPRHRRLTVPRAEIASVAPLGRR